MSTGFIDTNIFIRHLTNDHPIQSPASFKIIEAIEKGRMEAWTSDLVIAEIVFVLSSAQLYNINRETIADLLLPLISLRNLKLPYKHIYKRVFEIYRTTSVDYTDAYNCALIEKQKQSKIYSYDTDFDKIKTIERIEP